MIEQTSAHSPPPAKESYASWQATGLRYATMRRDMNDRTAGPIPSFAGFIMSDKTAQSVFTAQSLSTKTETAPDTAASGSYSFLDIIDIVNPLQHLPVIGTLYRKMTGDTIKPAASILGGAIFGGPIGAAANAINVVVQQGTGKDVAENAFALAGFDMASPVRPDITIMRSDDTLPGTTLALADLSKEQIPTSRNFAAPYKPSAWNG